MLFKVNCSEIPLNIAPSRPAQGADLIAIGNPQGLTFSATRGTLSAYRTNEHGTLLIQTDAAISGGNSGGPLLNSRGEAVGIVTSKMVKEGVENIGFAISLNWLMKHFNISNPQ
ncbi:MAG: trypsin-like peptidase domain-containing protein [Bacteroidota bacterium]